MRFAMRAMFFLAVLLSAVSGLDAQPCQGELRVFVKDSQEAPIFDAHVTIADRSLATPASGIADFENLPCGSLTVSAGKAGFTDTTATVQISGTVPVEIALTMNPQANQSSMSVSESTATPVEQSSSQNYELRPAQVKDLPSRPVTVSDALPLVPGVVRSPDGELKLDGSGEQRSSLVVNESDVTDPATGKFGQTIPVDSVETMNVLSTPFLAQYGRFTQTVVAVETKRGGDKWHYDLNDPFPDFRIRSYHMRGIMDWTPHVVVGGPVIKNRLFIISALQYYLDKVQNRTLPFPFNVSKDERVNSFTQIDYILSQRQVLNVTAHFNPEHTNYVNPDYFHPEPVSPSYAQDAYAGTAAHHLGLWGGTLDTSISYQRFHTWIGAQGPDGEILTPQGDTGNFFGVQSRNALRREWLEIWPPAPLRFLGAHQVKLGTSLTDSTDHGVFNYQPVEIENASGLLLERIDFVNRGPYKRNDLEFTGYVQDHWTVLPTLALDGGVRV
ncbi:MAG TPA: carboxypeptidase regulatory-like domain-containing protein, partial [Bryobacteraceae bacterium]|nr:carboxypeptidase regulatory-like domain-containing protein [Bryobacteraceae bacterium]